MKYGSTNCSAYLHVKWIQRIVKNMYIEYKIFNISPRVIYGAVRKYVGIGW